MCLTYSQLHKFNFTVHKGPSSVRMVFVEEDTSFYVMMMMMMIIFSKFQMEGWNSVKSAIIVTVSSLDRTVSIKYHPLKK